MTDEMTDEEYAAYWGPYEHLTRKQFIAQLDACDALHPRCVGYPEKQAYLRQWDIDRAEREVQAHLNALIARCNRQAEGSEYYLVRRKKVGTGYTASGMAYGYTAPPYWVVRIVKDVAALLQERDWFVLHWGVQPTVQLDSGVLEPR